jgi:hypothetical protein
MRVSQNSSEKKLPSTPSKTYQKQAKERDYTYLTI